MDEARIIEFSSLPGADLFVDAIYRGGRRGNSSDDPLNPLLRVSNQGGFRYRGSLENLELVVLTTTFNEPDWPDSLDRETGIFTYYGDNRHPGRGLHETRRHGNEVLRRIFELAHSGPEGRSRVPPVLVFAKAGYSRDVIFLGLAVPGSVDLRPSEDLVAIWKTSENRRFQNYRARFTILDAQMASRKWIQNILEAQPDSENAPKAWLAWKETGRYRPLLSARSIAYRTKIEQSPKDSVGKAIIDTLHTYFADDPYEFEKCAAAISRMMLPDIATLDLTRPSRDGGRDGTGQFRIGIESASILVDFALEAKCYAVSQSVGVKEVARLISRLRHRQFGILVTTSFVERQAYKEICEDQHPIVIISAADIVALFRANGLADIASVRNWLLAEFPIRMRNRTNLNRTDA